jgi:predicted histone-like DNA-binding protein
MAIKFKVVQKTQPGVVGGGVKKYYAVIVTDGEVTVEELSKRIEKFSSLSEADIYGVLIALENVIQEELTKNKIIRLQKLGSFYPAIKSEGEENEEDVDARSIKGAGVNYRPGDRILAAMNAAGFKKTV